MLKKNKSQKKGPSLSREAIPHLFLVLGFFGAAVTTEVMNVMHELSKSLGRNAFLIYAIFIILILWPAIIIGCMKAIEHLFPAKKKWWKFWR